MTLPEEWYAGNVDLTAITDGELFAELEAHMPRDSFFSGYENLCALWDEYRRRGVEHRDRHIRAFNSLEKNVTRHIDQCPDCEDLARAHSTVMRLLAERTI